MGLFQHKKANLTYCVLMSFGFMLLVANYQQCYMRPASTHQHFDNSNYPCNTSRWSLVWPVCCVFLQEFFCHLTEKKACFTVIFAGGSRYLMSCCLRLFREDTSYSVCSSTECRSDLHKTLFEFAIIVVMNCGNF